VNENSIGSFRGTKEADRRNATKVLHLARKRFCKTDEEPRQLVIYVPFWVCGEIRGAGYGITIMRGHTWIVKQARARVSSRGERPR
jgi:hypothetical protein